MEVLDKKIWIEAFKQATIVLIGGPLILLIPLIGELLAKIPTTVFGPIIIAWGTLVAGATALVAGNLLLGKLGLK